MIAVSKIDDKSGFGGIKDVTYVNALEGELETRYYRKSNIAGMNFRAEIERDDQMIRLTVKGAGPYYSKLSLHEGLREVQTAVVCRLQEAVQQAKTKKSQR